MGKFKGYTSVIRDDGATEITFHHQTKVIMVEWKSGGKKLPTRYTSDDGSNLKRKKKVTLHSFDGGLTWGTNPKKMMAQIDRHERLHPGYADKVTASYHAQTKRAEEEARPPDNKPVILPLQRIGAKNDLFAGRGKAKRPRRTKNFRDVKPVMSKNPLHYHRCHNQKFICACDESWRRRKCGTTHCLQIEMFSILAFGRTTDGKPFTWEPVGDQPVDSHCVGAIG